MRYKNIHEGVFLSRPNRFIANIQIDGMPAVCHVKNTGRCKELLIPGARIFVQKCDNPGRKTAYDLIAVMKGERLINMDAAAPNTVFGEFLASGGLGFVPDFIKPEKAHGDSRFDFYFEHSGKRAFAEVKGVTLEDNGIVRFPDAPTERGVKHINGLIKCVEEGFEAYAVFIVQMEKTRYFEPNRETHQAFADALTEAKKAGVKLLAIECQISPHSLKASEFITVKV